jgi:hypothetical protein
MSCYVVCQRPDKTGATGYLAANYDPRTGVRLILTGNPAMRYAYPDEEAAKKAATQANLPHEIYEGDTKEQLDCPQMMVIPACGN